MSKHGLICFVALISATGAALAADAGGKAAIPNFATDSGTGWRIDRTVGVDDLLAAPGGGPGPITNNKAYPYVPNGGGRQPTYRVADLSNPILQVPGIDVDAFAAPVFLYQTPKEVVYIMNNGPEVRHIYLDVPHSQNPKPSWYGESVGHYENGDTLVVDTIGFNDRVIDNYRTPRTTQLHVIERWKISPDGNAVDVSVYVEDPGVFTTPWRAMHRWRRVQQPYVEYYCAENNNNPITDSKLVPMPQATKPDF